MEIFYNLCRCCNSEKENCLNIHNNKSSNGSDSIINMIQYCLQATISNEPKYPAQICYDCVKQLEISYKFIKRFRLSQTEFEEAYKHIQQIKEENIQRNVDENICNTTNKDDINKISHKSNGNSLDKVDISTVIPMPSKNKEPTNEIHDEKISSSLPVIYVAPATETLPDVICYVCQKTFFTTKALNLHLKLKHKKIFT